MTATKADPQMALYNAVRDALDDHQFHLEDLAAMLRFKQLHDNVLHPDDSCGWDANGSDLAMKELEGVLLEQGSLDVVECQARWMFAVEHLARRLMETIDGDGDLGRAIDTYREHDAAVKSAAILAEAG